MANELIAYILLGIIAAVAVPWIAVSLIRRKRRKARLRGDKRFGH
jgi:type II secretory pathway pseudopilin PulG